MNMDAQSAQINRPRSQSSPLSDIWVDETDEGCVPASGITTAHSGPGFRDPFATQRSRFPLPHRPPYPSPLSRYTSQEHDTLGGVPMMRSKSDGPSASLMRRSPLGGVTASVHPACSTPMTRSNSAQSECPRRSSTPRASLAAAAMCRSASARSNPSDLSNVATIRAVDSGPGNTGRRESYASLDGIVMSRSVAPSDPAVTVSGLGLGENEKDSMVDGMREGALNSELPRASCTTAPLYPGARAGKWASVVESCALPPRSQPPSIKSVMGSTKRALTTKPNPELQRTSNKRMRLSRSDTTSFKDCLLDGHALLVNGGQYLARGDNGDTVLVGACAVPSKYCHDVVPAHEVGIAFRAASSDSDTSARKQADVPSILRKELGWDQSLRTWARSPTAGLSLRELTVCEHLLSEEEKDEAAGGQNLKLRDELAEYASALLRRALARKRTIRGGPPSGWRLSELPNPADYLDEKAQYGRYNTAPTPPQKDPQSTINATLRAYEHLADPAPVPVSRECGMCAVDDTASETSCPIAPSMTRSVSGQSRSTHTSSPVSPMFEPDVENIYSLGATEIPAKATAYETPRTASELDNMPAVASLAINQKWGELQYQDMALYGAQFEPCPETRISYPQTLPELDNI